VSFYYFDEFNHLKTLLFVLNLEKIKYLIDLKIFMKAVSKNDKSNGKINFKIKKDNISAAFGVFKRKGSTAKLLKETDRELDPENYK